MRLLPRLSLMPAAALLVHQLRFMLAFGGGAGRELQRQGHAYLHSITPWVVLLIAAAVGWFLRALSRAWSGEGSLRRYTLSLLGLWLACTACLLAIYVSQELLEGALATGHPIGIAGVFGYGGWWAIPAAACVGLVVAALLHGARWVVCQVARRRRRPAIAVPRILALLRPRDAFVPRLAPLAHGWSGRGPPH